MKASNALGTALQWALIGVVVLFFLSLAVSVFAPADWQYAREAAAVGKVCRAVLMVASTAVALCSLGVWFISSGKDQTAAGPPVVDRTADIEPRTFGFRGVKVGAVMSWVSAGVFLLPLVAAVVAAGFALSGRDDAWPVAGVLGLIGLIALPFVWLLGVIGRRYARARVTVDGYGIEARTVYGSGRFGWHEVTAFTREERDIGAWKPQWFLCVYAGERVLTIDPWLKDADELVSLVELASGQELLVIPQNAVAADLRKPTAFRRRWTNRAG